MNIFYKYLILNLFFLNLSFCMKKDKLSARFGTLNSFFKDYEIKKFIIDNNENFLKLNKKISKEKPIIIIFTVNEKRKNTFKIFDINSKYEKEVKKFIRNCGYKKFEINNKFNELRMDYLYIDIILNTK